MFKLDSDLIIPGGHVAVAGGVPPACTYIIGEGQCALEYSTYYLLRVLTDGPNRWLTDGP